MSGKVQVQGAKSNEEMKAESQMETEVQESAAVMDLVKPLAVEVTPPDRDLKNAEPQSKKIAKAEATNEDTLSAVREAEPAKAKTRQKRVRKNLEPTPPQGNMTPDYLKEMQTRFDKMEEMHKQTHELMGALQKVYASQTPLQQNGVIPRSQKIRRVEAPNYTKNYEDMDEEEDVNEIPLHNTSSSTYRGGRGGHYRPAPPERQAPNVDTHDVDLYTRRNKEALRNLTYDTTSTMGNRLQSSESQRKEASWYSSGW